MVRTVLPPTSRKLFSGRLPLAVSARRLGGGARDAVVTLPPVPGSLPGKSEAVSACAALPMVNSVFLRLDVDFIFRILAFAAGPPK